MPLDYKKPEKVFTRQCSFHRCECEGTQQHDDRYYCSAHIEYLKTKYQSDKEHLADTRLWLLENGVTTQGMTESERMKALSDYRQSLSRAPKEPDPAWASVIIGRWEHGDYAFNGIPYLTGYKIACGVLGVSQKSYGCKARVAA